VLRSVDEPERVITLAGPGAGPDVTAANLWAEILEACGPACRRAEGRASLEVAEHVEHEVHPASGG
jgi:hypothetical protein